MEYQICNLLDSAGAWARQKSSQGADGSLRCENPENPGTKNTIQESLACYLTHGARHGPTGEKGLSQETVPPSGNQQVAYHTNRWCHRLCLGLGRVSVTESKMLRHLEIQAFRRIKALFAKTQFSWPRLNMISFTPSCSTRSPSGPSSVSGKHVFSLLRWKAILEMPVLLSNANSLSIAHC